MHPDKSVAYELSVPEPATSYRAFKFEMPACQAVAVDYVNNVSLGDTLRPEQIGNNTGAELTFSRLIGSAQNSFTIKRYDCPPAEPLFDTTPRVLAPYRLVLTDSAVTSFLCQFRVDVPQFPELVYPQFTSAYLLDSSGIYHRLPTEYDSVYGQLIFNCSAASQIIFGIAPDINAPLKALLIAPTAGDTLFTGEPTVLEWNQGSGAALSEIRIATDGGLTKMVIDTVMAGNDSLSLMLNAGYYYWAVRAGNLVGWGDWSDTSGFDITTPYMQMISPKGGELVFKDSSGLNVRWADNLKGYLRIELNRSNSYYLTIADSVPCRTGSFLWSIPDSVPAGIDYRVVVRYMDDPAMFAESENDFPDSRHEQFQYLCRH